MEKWKEGQCSLSNEQKLHAQTYFPKMPKLRGRWKEKYNILEKLINCKKNRLFNLYGWPGMGKSALIASVLDYIKERTLVKGGIIYFNAKNIRFVEVFIHSFTQVLIAENPQLLSSTQAKGLD